MGPKTLIRIMKAPNILATTNRKVPFAVFQAGITRLCAFFAAWRGEHNFWHGSVLLQAAPLRGHRKSMEEWDMDGVKVLARSNMKDLDAREQ